MPGIMLSMLHLILTATKDIIIFNVMYYQKTEIPETLSNLPEVMELVSAGARIRRSDTSACILISIHT